jgi:Flp pilus assembly protein TadD
MTGIGKMLRTAALPASLLLLAACQGAGSVNSDLPSHQAKQDQAETQAPSRDSGLSDSQAGELEMTVRQEAAQAEATYDYAEAAQHYVSLLAKHPADQDLLLAAARNLRCTGSPQQAIAIVYSRLSATGEANEPLLIELGRDYLAADQLKLAISSLQQAYALDSHNWEILSAWGVALDYQGSYGDAQAKYKEGLALSPNNPTLLNNYALSLAQTGKLDAAIAMLQDAAGQPKSTVQNRQNLALLLALKGDNDGAARIIQADLPSAMAQNNIAYYRGLAAR